jgi:methionyl-tRNA formyltransferase
MGAYLAVVLRGRSQIPCAGQMMDRMAHTSLNKRQPKITLFLMTEKGFYFLKHTHERFGILFSNVVIGSDKSLQKDYESEIMELCIETGIPFIKRTEFMDIKTEYALSISWRWMIKHPSDKLIIFHDSLLPKYRGFAPLVNYLINGESQIGVSAIFGNDKFDTGNIITQSKSDITYPITISMAIEIVVKNYIECANIIFDNLLCGCELKSYPQIDSESTYSVWRDECDYSIDWQKSSTEIRRFIDAVGYPYKGASTKLDTATIRVLSAEEARDVNIENRNAGKVLFVEEGKPIVICGSGMLKITNAIIELPNNKKRIFKIQKFRVRFTS